MSSAFALPVFAARRSRLRPSRSPRARRTRGSRHPTETTTNRPSPEMTGPVLSPPADDPSARAADPGEGIGVAIVEQHVGRAVAVVVEQVRRVRRKRDESPVGADATAASCLHWEDRRFGGACDARCPAADRVADVDLSHRALAARLGSRGRLIERRRRGKCQPSSVRAQARQDAVAVIGLNAG